MFYPEHLFAAWHLVQHRSKAAGVDGITVDLFAPIAGEQTSNGRYFGRLETSGQARIDYLTQQVIKSYDSDFIRKQAESIIVGKLHNSRIMLQRLNRRRKTDVATKAIKELADIIQTMPAAESVESMLGYEGLGANLYFRAFATLLKGPFEFEKRTRRPPTDQILSKSSRRLAKWDGILLRITKS